MSYICSKTMLFTYSLFTGQKVFPDAEEILSILPQAFDEAFLQLKRREMVVDSIKIMYSCETTGPCTKCLSCDS